MTDYMQLAFEQAAKSRAKKRKVGCVIVCESIHGTPMVYAGFNLNRADIRLPCEDEHGNTLPTVDHAEAVAVRNFEFGQADNESTNIDRTVPPRIFITHQPCENCVALLADFLRKHFSPGFDLRSCITIAETGMKFDTNKLRIDLVPPGAIEALAAVLTYGAKKYKPNNWRSVEAERYVAAFERHWLAYRQGELLDSESGLPHLAHCMTNLSFLLELNHRPQRQLTLADYCKNS